LLLLDCVGEEDAELYRNRKGYFSLNTQVTCNSNLEITNIGKVLYITVLFLITVA